MIFVINNLKYDTNKMELISEKCEYKYQYKAFASTFATYAKEVKLWKSVHNRWLLTYTRGCSTVYAVALLENEASTLLKDYDLGKYEELFGELEEA